MSTGMRQKLALAVVLATEAPLLILDEPTANLDPTARAEVLTLVREAQAAGRTVLFSSHVLSEVEETCDRVAILHRGSLVYCGRWQDAGPGGSRWKIETPDTEKCAAVFRGLGLALAPDGTLALPDKLDSAAVVAALVAAGVRVGEFRKLVRTLEDFYLERTG